MGADRFYCPDVQMDQISRLEGDEARHLARVRRVAVGADVELFDGRGRAVMAEVIRVGRDEVELRVRRLLDPAPAAPVSVTLAVAIPKGDRFDWLVEKATELGVERLIPLATERSTVDPRAAKLDRLRRAVIESCKQCRRNTLMTIAAPVAWETWAATPASPQVHRWLAHPGGATTWDADQVGTGTAVIVAVGPEGGFTEPEVGLARAVGWRPIHLTGTILRVETAALAAAAHLMLGATKRTADRNDPDDGSTAS